MLPDVSMMTTALALCLFSPAKIVWGVQLSSVTFAVGRRPVPSVGAEVSSNDITQFVPDIDRWIEFVLVTLKPASHIAS